MGFTEFCALHDVQKIPETKKFEFNMNTNHLHNKKNVQVFACTYKSLILLSFNLFLANLKTSAETFRLLVQVVNNTHHRMD